MRRGNGSILGPYQTTSVSSAGGIWNSRDQQERKGAGVWPVPITRQTFTCLRLGLLLLVLQALTTWWLLVAERVEKTSTQAGALVAAALAVC